MKKLDKQREADFALVKLYLDDLERIEEILKEASQDNFSIQTEEFSYESVKELKDNIKQQNLKKLTIKTYQPSILIFLRKSSATLTVRTESYEPYDEVKADGYFYRLNEIISKRTIGPKWLFISEIYFLLFSLLLSAQLLVPKKLLYLLPLTSVSIVLLVMFCLSICLNSKSYSIVWLTYSHDQNSFWQRNRDQLILATVSALLGCISGIIGTLIVTYLTKK